MTIVALLAFFISPLHGQDEVRALWVVRTTLTAPSAIETMVKEAKNGGFNTLLVQVRGRGDAYFQAGLEPRPAALSAQPAFDPLATTIAAAHATGLRVHAWINVNLIASAAELPAAREHVIYRHPEWVVDVICPMAYTTDASVFATQIAAAKQAAGSHQLWAGIGAYRLSSEQIVDNTQTARRLGASGVILFSYDSLADSTHGPGYVAQVGRALTSQF